MPIRTCLCTYNSYRYKAVFGIKILFLSSRFYFWHQGPWHPMTNPNASNAAAPKIEPPKIEPPKKNGSRPRARGNAGPLKLGAADGHVTPPRQHWSPAHFVTVPRSAATTAPTGYSRRLVKAIKVVKSSQSSQRRYFADAWAVNERAHGALGRGRCGRWRRARSRRGRRRRPAVDTVDGLRELAP